MNKARILVGDSLEILQKLEDKSVQCVVTSPPYYGLRDYGNERQLGRESRPNDFVENLCKVFDQVWRVLRDDGTLWLNLGDSYSGSGKGAYSDGTVRLTEKSKIQQSNQGTILGTFTKGSSELPPKNLLGIPWRVAFALQDRGWILRSDIIWHKPNVMPESTTDRPTKSHEYIFLLTKSVSYFYNADAIREPVSEVSIARAEYGFKTHRPSAKNARGIDVEKMGDRFVNPMGRNKRTVWTIPAKGYKEAHFATYPPELIIPCILAGSKEGDVILDPFSGSGTTGEVALKHGRDYIGIELNPNYAEISRKRISDATGLFGEIEVIF